MLINGERALAYIEEVKDIKPIEKADRLELVFINGWQVVCGKGDFKKGDKGVFFEIDSLLPNQKPFSDMEFLVNKKFKIKTQKIRGAFSQGLFMPLSAFGQELPTELHTDVTQLLGVTYYVAEDNKRKSKTGDPDAKYKNMVARNRELAKKKWFKWFMRRNWGKKLMFFFFGRKKDNPKKFPAWIKKTDEDRVENMTWVLSNKEPFVVTEKIDGCLDGNVSVVTDIGIKKISEIVNQRIDCNVLTYNTSLKRCEYQPIENYYKWERVSDMYDIVVSQMGYRCGNRPKHIRCTSNHSFYIGNGEYKKSSELKAGDTVFHRFETIDSMAKEILLGILLGDGSLSSKNGVISGAIDFSHSANQKQYFDETVRLLGFGNCSIRELTSGYGSQMFSCHYKTNSEFKELVRSICWNGAKKYISKEWCNMLTPISLAFWYMDDGSIRNADDDNVRPRLSLATNNFDDVECQLLIDCLDKRFNIKANVFNGDSYKGNTITLDTDNTDKFCALVAPYIFDSMKYKLPKYMRCIKYSLGDYECTNGSSIIETKIISASKIDDYNKKYVFDLTIANNHNYFANGVLTHNTSTTFFLDLTCKKPDFGVCSRNVRQLDMNQETFFGSEVPNVYWEMAFKYDIKEVLEKIAKRYNAKRVVLQGETYGESVQGNPYKMDERCFAAFNLIIDGVRQGSLVAKDVLSEYDVPFVPIIEEAFVLPDELEELKVKADGKSTINKKVLREGFVYRNHDASISFKNISREFLLKKKD